MAEFTFYGSWEDSIAILDRLIQLNQFTFIVNKRYSEPVPLTFNNLNADQNSDLEAIHNLFLYSERYSLYPPYFVQVKADKTWFIDPPPSGPALDLGLPKLRYESTIENTVLGRGILIYQSKYWHPETLEYYSPPQALKDAFKLVKKIITQNCEKRYISFRYFGEGQEKHQILTLFIGKFGMELIRRGNACINMGINGYITDSDLSKNRQSVKLPIE
jgi:hypothetical protein